VAWFLAGIACIFLVIKYRRFRHFLLATLGLAVLGIVAYVVQNKHSEEVSRHMVNADQLQFTDLRLGSEGYGTSYKLSGRVKNNSPFYVFEVKAKFQILDCDDSSHCDVVGEEEEWNICPLVPPGQVRDIDTTIYFGSGTHVRGQFQWNYTITEVRARQGAQG